MTSAMVSPLSPLWAARSIAVIGATERVGALGRLPISYLQRYGFGGRILPVHPSAGSVLGLPAHVTVAAARDATGPVDLALVMVAAPRVPAAIDDCAAAGVPVAVVMLLRLRRDRRGGRRLCRKRSSRRARAGGMRVVGPNCIGAVGFATGRWPSFSARCSRPTTYR